MQIIKNHDIVEKIMIADLQGKSAEDIKPLYIKRNIFDIDENTPIYRIFQYDYIYDDIRDETLTHVKASPSVWKDDLENPLLNFCFTDECGEKLRLSGLVNNIYALCWTKNGEERMIDWQIFSYGRPSIRVKTTPRKLMDHAMNINDKYFMLHHNLGLVQYLDEKDISGWIVNSHYSSHLDSLGQGIALSTMVLSDIHSSEQEVRLIYSYSPQEDNPWVKDNVAIKEEGKLCAMPFNWGAIIDEILLGPMLSINNEDAIRTLLNDRGISCNISSSQFR